MEKNYIKTLNLNTISLLNLNYIIENNVLPLVINDVLNYYKEMFDITKTAHKQFLYHHFIEQTCEIYKKEKTFFTYIFYFNPDNTCFVDKEIILLIKKLNKVLPIVYFNDKIPFEFIDDKFKTGEILELKEKINIVLNKKNNKDYNFQGIISLAKKYKLTFLSEQYFNDLKTKHKLCV